MARFARFFSSLARFFSGLGLVQFGFFGYRLIKLKPNRTGQFFQNFNRFFFSRFGFFGYFFLFSRCFGFLLTPNNYNCFLIFFVVAGVITQFWVIPQNKFLFFKIKTKNNKGWQRGESRPGNQVVIFRGDSRPSCAPLCSKLEKTNANSRSN